MANVPPRKATTLRRDPSSQSHHIRRSSTSERLDEILENARERADNLAAHDGRASPADLRRSRTSLSFDEGGGGVDETTAMLGGGRRRGGYQGTTEVGSEQPRLRKASAYARSQSSVLDQTTREQASDDEGGAEEEAEEEGETWWQRAVGPFRSVELENKGSVARDHLALERTFLAWLRTSLAFASIGIAVTQLFRLNTSLPDTGGGHDVNRDTLRHVGKPLGASFIVISIVILLLGYRRYFQGQKWIIRGKFPASRGTVIVVVLVALAIMILSLVVVIAIHPKER